MTAKGDTMTMVSSKVSTQFAGSSELLMKAAQQEDDEDDTEAASKPSSPTSEKAPDSPEATEDPRNDEKKEQEGLITMKVPTHTSKSRKRKHISTNFDESTLLDQAAIDAQRKEQERLERQRKKEESVSNTDHIQQVVALQDLPVIDLTDSDFLFDVEDPTPPVLERVGTSFDQHEVIVVSSDDDDEIQEVGSVTHVSYDHSPRKNRWNIPEREKGAYDEMEKQQKLEEERLRRKAHLLKDLERVETSRGQLVVNKGHPPDEPDITVAAHLTHKLQPHQLGGICFMYNNVIESLEEYKRSPGFGCILAHSMGLGKTLQIVTFTEIFFRATKAHKVLIIVPINTIQNWWNEYEKWMPQVDEAGNKLRNFNVFILGDSVKGFDQRVNLLEKWSNEGGVLIIGYDMFRLLLRTTNPKKKTAKPRMKLNFINGQRIREEIKDDSASFDSGYTTAGREKKAANDIIRRALLDPGPELVVCDEGHKIKNLTTDISVALSAIKTTRRIVLTGYPLQNNLMEYYCMVDFVRPKYLGEKKTFSIMFEKPIKNGQCMDSTFADRKLSAQRTHVLIEKLKGFVQRRSHHLLKKILPQSKEYVILLRKSPLQRILYRNFLVYAQSEISNGSNVFNPLKAFAACSKIWNHPDILHKTLVERREKRKKDLEVSSSSSNSMSPFGSPQALTMALNGMNWQPPKNEFDLGDFSLDEDLMKLKKGKKTIFQALLEENDMDMDGLENGLKYDWADLAMGNHQTGILEHGYKMKIAIEIIRATIAMGEKILLFSQNLTALDLMEQYLKQEYSENGEKIWIKNKSYFRLDGTTNGTEREKLIKRFNGEKTVNLFLISTKAGSLGINLVSANRCIILDACWNPCHDAQAVCRVYRYGQQKETFIYRLIMDNSMEKAIFNRQISKHGLQQRVVDDVKVDANVTQKELETLLMYDEALDINKPVFETPWEIEDDVLKKISEMHIDMFSAEPFLHESLLIEREEGLSEQEKMEAKVMFERERMAETQTLYTQNRSNNMINEIRAATIQHPAQAFPANSYGNFQNNMQRPNINSMNGGYMTAGQMPYTNTSYTMNAPQIYNTQAMVNPMNTMALMNQNTINIQMPNTSVPQTQFQQYPTTSYQNVSSYGNGMPMNNGNMAMNMNSNMNQNSYGNYNGYSQQYPSTSQTNGNYNQPNTSYQQQQSYPQQIYKFKNGSESCPGLIFPGAVFASAYTTNDSGSAQTIILDRPMILPCCSIVGQSMQLNAGDELSLVKNNNGVFIKTSDGVMLNATNSIFDTAANMAFNQPVTSTITPLPNLGPMDLIELD